MGEGVVGAVILLLYSLELPEDYRPFLACPESAASCQRRLQCLSDQHKAQEGCSYDHELASGIPAAECSSPPLRRS